jgi:predicted NAD/FAD-dependent oxidoreductase
VIQAAPDWSAARYDDPVADNVAALAAAAADVVGDERLADSDWTDHKRWRYALPETDRGLLPGVRRDAEAHDCYVAGDRVPGEARLHAALRSGLAVAERVAYAP